MTTDFVRSDGGPGSPLRGRTTAPPVLVASTCRGKNGTITLLGSDGLEHEYEVSAETVRRVGRPLDLDGLLEAIREVEQRRKTSTKPGDLPFALAAALDHLADLARRGRPSLFENPAA